MFQALEGGREEVRHFKHQKKMETCLHRRAAPVSTSQRNGVTRLTFFISPFLPHPTAT